jgi:ATP-dependent 26S proteasome regulatory subunit
VVDIDKNIDINDVTPNCRVALRNDSYTLHKILPNKVDPLVSLMMVEKVPDSTYEMVGGLDKQIKEIKEVRKILLADSRHCTVHSVADLVCLSRIRIFSILDRNLTQKTVSNLSEI